MGMLNHSLNIGELKLKNRLVVPPMATNTATEEGHATEETVNHYSRRAAAGVAMIIVEHTYVSPGGRAGEKQLGVYDDGQTAGLAELASGIKEAGAAAAIQITHAGSNTDETLVETPWGPSAVEHPGSKIKPQRLDERQLEEVKRNFVAASERVCRAGFDVVELHGAHGYLLNQFLSPLTNEREDRYGGSLAERARFPLEVVKSVSDSLSGDAVLAYRLGVDDFMPGGLTLEETARYACWLDEAGVDLIDISGGMAGYGIVDSKPGYFERYGKVLKRKTESPVMVTGGITTAELAEHILTQGGADLIGVGRAILKEASWSEKALDTARRWEDCT